MGSRRTRSRRDDRFGYDNRGFARDRTSGGGSATGLGIRATLGRNCQRFGSAHATRSHIRLMGPHQSRLDFGVNLVNRG
jgi:hypothetical protein